jgi:hypothetical protein
MTLELLPQGLSPLLFVPSLPVIWDIDVHFSPHGQFLAPSLKVNFRDLADSMSPATAGRNRKINKIKMAVHASAPIASSSVTTSVIADPPLA